MKQIQDAYIVAATRTPIGRSGRGYFRNTRPDDLLVAAIRSAMKQVPTLDPAAIEDAIVTHRDTRVRVLATLGGEPILVREKNVTGATFHPELTGWENAWSNLVMSGYTPDEIRGRLRVQLGRPAAGGSRSMTAIAVKLGTIGPHWTAACRQAVTDLNLLFRRKGIDVTLALNGHGPEISIGTDPGILGSLVHGRTSAETDGSGRLVKQVESKPRKNLHQPRLSIWKLVQMQPRLR